MGHQQEGRGRGKEAKEIHKQQEKELRDKLNTAYDNLRAQLPATTTAKRVSKQLVLKLATETSQAIRAEETTLKTQMSTLTKTHLLLQEKLAKLQATQKPQQEDAQTEEGGPSRKRFSPDYQRLGYTLVSGKVGSQEEKEK